jgi:hypothetical protein
MHDAGVEASSMQISYAPSGLWPASLFVRRPFRRLVEPVAFLRMLLAIVAVDFFKREITSRS